MTRLEFIMHTIRRCHCQFTFALLHSDFNCTWRFNIRPNNIFKKRRQIFLFLNKISTSLPIFLFSYANRFCIFSFSFILFDTGFIFHSHPSFYSDSRSLSSFPRTFPGKLPRSQSNHPPFSQRNTHVYFTLVQYLSMYREKFRYVAATLK